MTRAAARLCGLTMQTTAFHAHSASQAVTPGPTRIFGSRAALKGATRPGAGDGVTRGFSAEKLSRWGADASCPTATEKEKMAGQKIRIRLRAYDHEVIDSSAKKIVDTVTRTGAKVAGPVPLPTEKNVYCVIRSPHKYKDSREHFEMRTHKRLIDILDPTPKTVDSLMRLDLPAGVDIEIKLP